MSHFRIIGKTFSKIIKKHLKIVAGSLCQKLTGLLIFNKV